MRWDLKPEEISVQADLLMKISQAVYDSIGALKAEDVTYDNVIKALGDNSVEYENVRNMLDFLQHVSPDKALRDASVTSDKKLSEFDVEISMREDVFQSLLALEKKLGDTLEPEAKRFLERHIKMGRRNGLHLLKEVQEEIKAIKKEISDLSIDFSKNLNEENTVLEFTAEELDGLPADLLNSLERTELGLYKLTLKYPHVFPCFKFVKKPETRRKVDTAFNSRCINENTPILEKLVKLRQKKATLLDFPTHSAFVLDMRMAKSPERVAKFLTDLQTKLCPLRDSDLALFLEYKQQECKELGIEFDGKINSWDMRYYMTRVEERKYSVDENKLKEYFSLEVVTKGLLGIYQDLLNLKFELVPGHHSWHEDATLYSVFDNDMQSLIGYFYLDLFPRPGKYGHAACFGLQPRSRTSDGTTQVAVGAMVANFTKSTADQPSLLSHDEVETYFHEFGHVMHRICAETQFSLFSGTAVERDFVEAPSQMLENWCWERESLARMSAHYKDGSAIPDDLLVPLLNSRKANAGVFNMRQITLATFDQTIHTRPEVDTAAVFREVSEKILGVPVAPGTNMAASFGHLAGGYDAQYYGYLWSEVFSADMFHSRFKTEGVMNAKVGSDYKNFILKPGGSLDAEVMLRNFLGRDPKEDAFLVSKGLSV